MTMRKRVYIASVHIYRLIIHPLFMLAATIAILWGLYQSLSEANANTTQKYQLLFMGIGFSFCVVFVIWRTKYWTLRSLGILAEHFAGAVLYGSAGIAEFHPIDVALRRDIQDIARSSFFVSVVLLIAGLLLLLRHPPAGPTEERDIAGHREERMP